MPKNRFRNKGGFTLVELLITVAIVAILAAVAYPTFLDQIQKARRVDAQAAMLQNAQFLERVYTETGCYNAGADNTCATSADAGVTLPIAESPLDDSTKYYDHTVQNLTATAFTLRAVPKHAQTDDKCGTMTINQVGQKTPGGSECWRK